MRKKRILFKIILIILYIKFCFVSNLYGSTDGLLNFSGYIEDAHKRAIENILVFIISSEGKISSVTYIENGFFNTELMVGKYTLLFIKNSRVILQDEIEINKNNFNKKVFIIRNTNFNKNNSKKLLPLDFLLGLLSGIFSGLSIWYLRDKIKIYRANKYFPYLSEIIIKEIDIFCEDLKKNVDKGLEEYSELIKNKLSHLENFSDNILKNYNWLMQSMYIKKSTLIIEIKPILRDWSKFIEKEKNSVELILNYFSSEKENKKGILYLGVKDLKDKLDKYKEKLLSHCN